MKSFKKILIMLTLLLLCAISLCSCGGSADAPEGMQLVMGGEELGFYFYSPEEWIVANHGEVAASYASTVNSTSVTFTKIDAPTGEISKEYFITELNKLPFKAEVKSFNSNAEFGNAKKACSCTFGYEYKGRSFLTMQIIASFDGEFYLFTYNSYDEKRVEEETYYSYYLPKAEACIKNIKFVEKKAGSEVQKPEYEKDSDGYLLVSDKTLSGFELYVPKDYAVDYSSGIVSVSRADGTSINVSKATYTGVTRDEYWKTRVENIEAVCDRLRDEKTGEVLTEEVTDKDGKTEVKELTTLKIIKEHKLIELEGCDWACAYEYTFSFGGTTYHLYQVLIVDGYDGFVFTYSAPEAVYSSHIDEMQTILNKLGY